MAGNLNGQYRRPDRSEIGPYLGSSSGGLWVAEKSTAPAIYEVGIKQKARPEVSLADAPELIFSCSAFG